MFTFCKCFATSILPPPDKFMEYQQAVIDGKDVSDWQWEGEVKDVPGEFNKWVKDNEERIAKAKSLPYFLKDNQQYAGIKTKGSVEHSESEQIRHLGVQGNLAHKETKASEMRNDVPLKPLKPEPGVLEYTRKQAEQIGAKMTEPMPGWFKANFPERYKIISRLLGIS